MSKKISLIFVTLLLLIIPLAFAITGSVGSGKIYLKEEISPNQPTEIQRTIRVINNNDFPVTITISAVEDLTDITEIIDNDFVLKANEEKDARYAFTLVRPGTYSGKILTMFKPEEGNGIAISTEVQVIAYGEGDFPPPEDNTDDNTNQNNTNTDDNTNQDDTTDNTNTDDNTNQDDNTNTQPNTANNNPSTTPSKTNIKTDNIQPTTPTGQTTKTTTTTKKPNPFYGTFLILAIVVLGLMIYFLLTKNSGSNKK